MSVSLRVTADKNIMKSKFNKNKNYKALCLIMSPNGMVKEGTILTGKQWVDILVYDVGNGFKQMFEDVT